jgi:hypothetical protein
MTLFTDRNWLSANRTRMSVSWEGPSHDVLVSSYPRSEGGVGDEKVDGNGSRNRVRTLFIPSFIHFP